MIKMKNTHGKYKINISIFPLGFNFIKTQESSPDEYTKAYIWV